MKINSDTFNRIKIYVIIIIIVINCLIVTLQFSNSDNPWVITIIVDKNHVNPGGPCNNLLSFIVFLNPIYQA